MWFLYWNPDSLENLECLLFLLTDSNWYIDRLHSWYGGLVIEKRFFRGEWYFIALDHYFLCSFFWIKKYCLINSQLRSLVFVIFNFNWPHPFMCPGKISVTVILNVFWHLHDSSSIASCVFAVIWVCAREEDSMNILLTKSYLCDCKVYQLEWR